MVDFTDRFGLGKYSFGDRWLDPSDNDPDGHNDLVDLVEDLAIDKGAVADRPTTGDYDGERYWARDEEILYEWDPGTGAWDDKWGLGSQSVALSGIAHRESVSARDREIAVRVSKDSGGTISARHRDGREWSGTDVYAVLQSVADNISTGLTGIQAGTYSGKPQWMNYDPGTPRTYDMGTVIRGGKDVGVVGEGIGQTILTWDDDAQNNNGLVQLYGNGYLGATFADMTLDGNISNVGFVETDGAGGILTGGEHPDSTSPTTNRHGAVYRNLELINQPGSGLYSGFHDGGFDHDARFDNIIARNCAMPGVHFDFPHSSVATNIVCDSCGTGFGSNDWAISISGPSNAAGGNWKAQDFHLSGVSVYGGGWARIFGVYGVTIEGLSVHADGDLDQLWGVGINNATDLEVGINQIERTGDPDADSQGVGIQGQADVSVSGGSIHSDRCVVFAGDGARAKFTGTDFVPASGGRSIVCFSDAEGQFGNCTLDDKNGAAWTMSLGANATMDFSGVKCTTDSPGTVVNSGADMNHEGTRNLGLSEAAEVTQSGDGTATSFDIPHGLAEAPSDVRVEARSGGAAGDYYIDMANTDGTSIRLEYASAPASGTDNLTWWYEASV